MSFRIPAPTSAGFRPPPLVGPCPGSTAVIDRIRGEYLEMPGLSPTLPQASRLFDMPLDECRRVLHVLQMEGFLRCSPEGQYRRT